MIKDLLEIFWSSDIPVKPRHTHKNTVVVHSDFGHKCRRLCDGVKINHVKSWLKEYSELSCARIESYSVEGLREAFVLEAVKKTIRDIQEKQDE